MKTPYQQYLAYLSYYRMDSNELSFTDWRELDNMERQQARIASKH